MRKENVLRFGRIDLKKCEESQEEIKSRSD